MEERIMGKRDKLLKQAFTEYYSANLEKKLSQEKNHSFAFEYTEGFEDKIYHCINRLHIANPRVKARRIKFGILLVLVFCFTAGVLIHYYKYKPADTTKKIEKLYQEAYAWHESNFYKNLEEQNQKDSEKEQENLTTVYTPPNMEGLEGKVSYEVLLLNTELTVKLEESGIKYQKTGERMSSSILSHCGVSEPMGWDVYELSDRKSHYYYILKDGAGQVAIARYAVCRTSWNDKQERAGTDTICEDIFGMKAVEDVRAVTLERYQARSKNEPEKLVAIYTGESEKQKILSIFQRNNLIRSVYEGMPDTEGGESALPEWCSIKELYGKGWKDAVSIMPEKCFLLALENRYQENFLMGVVVDGKNVQIFVDLKSERNSNGGQEDGTFENDAYCVELSKEQQQQISDWISSVNE